MISSWDLVIVGAGPAGMGASVEAARYGLKTLVLDRQSEAGGQIFRGLGSSSLVNRLGTDYMAGRTLLQEFQDSSVCFETDSNVWHVMPGQVFYSRHGQSYCAMARQILLATGAMERPVPLPGWELPGVMSAGAFDALLKSSSKAPEGPVVVCGNGPLIFQAVAHLLDFKVPIAGVLLTGRLNNMLRCLKHSFGILARPRYFARGLGLAARTFLRSRCSVQATQVSIREENESLNISCKTPFGEKSLHAFTVLLHEGVVSESRITRLARLRHVWDRGQRYWHAESDDWGQTNISGIRVAGDVSKVTGAVAAEAEGRLTAMDICRELGKLPLDQRDKLAAVHHRLLARCKALQPFLDNYFAPTLAMLHPAPHTIVCRCEELTAMDMKKTIEEGCYSPDGLKAQSRFGMGACQGRMCGPTVAEMIANIHGLELEDLPLFAAQPPLFPLSLRELADMPMPPSLL